MESVQNDEEMKKKKKKEANEQKKKKTKTIIGDGKMKTKATEKISE